MGDNQRIRTTRDSDDNHEDTQVDFSYYKRLLSEVRNEDIPRVTAPFSPTEKPVRFSDLISKERVRTRTLENDKKERENQLITSNQSLKRLTLNLLFALLYLESLVLFILAFFQGFSLHGFDLDPVTLRILVVATLAQISTMLTIAVRHLFPAHK